MISLRPRFVALTVGTTLAAAAVGVLRWLFAVVTVHGPSMEPALADGDRLLVRRCGAGRLRRSQLVIFREPGLKRRRPVWLTGAGQDVWVIKRVAAVAGDPVPASVRAAAGGECVVPRHAVVVLGDGPVSRDSRDWGFVPASHILGVGARRIAAGPAASGGRATPRLAD